MTPPPREVEVSVPIWAFDILSMAMLAQQLPLFTNFMVDHSDENGDF